MNWVVIAIAVLAIANVTSFIIILHLKKRLDYIDGFGGKITKDQNKRSETVIGIFGEDAPKEED